jgi:thioredoxin-dependent peroxiredoxin
VLEPGDRAPAFTLPDQNGEKVKLSDLKGQTVVLYFYPKADTGINSVACPPHPQWVASLASAK